jgi:hypothetical protein
MRTPCIDEPVHDGPDRGVSEKPHREILVHSRNKSNQYFPMPYIASQLMLQFTPNIHAGALYPPGIAVYIGKAFGDK